MWISYKSKLRKGVQKLAERRGGSCGNVWSLCISEEKDR